MARSERGSCFEHQGYHLGRCATKGLAIALAGESGGSWRDAKVK